MKKIITVLLVLFMWLHAKEYTVNLYTIEIDVNATKPNGLPWDIAGGAPDILVRIDGKTLPFDAACQDHYRCSLTFMETEKRSWYFEIYDRDFATNDLIGKGECSLNSACTLSGASLRIHE